MGSLRSYLNALVLAVLVPLLALATLLAANYARSERQIIEAQRVDVVNNLAFLVDREIESLQRPLQALAVSPELAAGRLQQFQQHVVAAFPGGGSIILSDEAGRVLVSTTAPGQPLPAQMPVDGHFQFVFGGNSRVSGFRVDAAQRPVFLVSVPVRVNNSVTYALSAEVEVARLASLFNEAMLKPEWIAAIVDSTGRLLARNIAFDRFAGQLVRPEAMEAAVGPRETGSFVNRSMEGVETSNTFQRSMMTGWTLFVAVPTQILHAPLAQAYRFLAVVGLGLTGLGLGLAYLLSERISRAVRKLETAALDVVEGRETEQIQYPVSEFGQVAKVFEYAAKITSERKRDERRLFESEERQRLAIDAGAFATWDLDVPSGDAVWSPRLFTLLGYEPQESQQATGQMWLDRVHPDDRAAAMAEAKAARREQRNYVSEYRIIRADTHEVRWLRSNGRFHFDDEGHARRLVGVIRDVTERKVMELTLRESETQYRSALTVGRMGSWETNFATGVRKWSPEAQDLFGMHLPGGIGQVGGDDDEFLRALHPDDRNNFTKLHDLAHTTDSFPAEYRIVRPDGTTVWLSGRGQVFSRTPEGQCWRLVSVMADVTEQKKSEEHVRFLLREMSHRSKNLLAVIQSIAGQTMRTSGSIGEFHGRFEQRLQGLAASHDILVDQNWQGATLSNLVRRQLKPFVDPDSARAEVHGPAVDLSAPAAQAIGLALHELATNAVKYGALSEPQGRVTISWDFDEAADEPTLILSWVERDGPRVSPPARNGFGNAVIQRMAPNSVSGTVSLEYAPTGLRWRLSIPAAALILNDDTPLPRRQPEPLHLDKAV